MSFEYYFVLIRVCIFLKQDYILFASRGVSWRSGDASFQHTEHTLWRKISAYWSCIAIFLAREVCFVCLKETSYRDVSFEHTDNAFDGK